MTRAPRAATTRSLVPLPVKFPTARKSGAARRRKDPCFWQEGRRKLASANGPEGGVALRGECIQAAIMHGR